MSEYQRFIQALWRHKILLALSYLGLVWGVVYAMMAAPPQYAVSALISLQPGLYGEDDGKLITPSTRLDDLARSQIALLESEDAIRRAVAIVGPEAVLRGGAVPMRMFDAPLAPVDAAYLAAKKALRVGSEAFTNLIEVTFSHGDPKVAVAFTKALLQSFAEKHNDLYRNAGAALFYREQQKLSDEAFARAAAALSAYSSSNQIFEIDEQRRLLLARRSQLAADLATTRGSIAEMDVEAALIPTQLSKMKPIGRLPQVVELTQQRAPPQRFAQGTQSANDSSTSSLASDPPLLLVRVYQDTIAQLVKLNTDVAGLRAKEGQQHDELTKLDEELSALTTKEADFERLRLNVTQARNNSELFTKKAFEEQLSQDLEAKKLSSIQIVQQPTLPLDPVWPKRKLVAIGAGLSLALFLALPILGRLSAASRRSSPRREPAEMRMG